MYETRYELIDLIKPHLIYDNMNIYMFIKQLQLYAIKKKYVKKMNIYLHVI